MRSRGNYAACVEYEYALRGVSGLGMRLHTASLKKKTSPARGAHREAIRYSKAGTKTRL